MTICGPRGPVPGPELRPPRVSLLTSAPVMEVDTIEGTRWVLGYEFLPESCGTDAQTFRLTTGYTKLPGERPELVSIDPFGIVTPATCSVFGHATQETQDELRAQARRKLRACEAYQIEEEFWTGAKVSANPHLASTDSEDITDTAQQAAGMAPSDALACLEGALGDCQCGGQAMIHMPRKLFTKLATEFAPFRRDGARILTLLDTIIVPGAGYTGSSPEGASSESWEWMYGTGIVTVRMEAGEDIPRIVTQAVDRSVNTMTWFAEKAAAVDFDPCCHLAVKVALTPCGPVSS
jgi:hypothetical protein